MTDTAPGTSSTPAALPADALPPNPDKPEPPKADTAPKRPTTRAGRAAAAKAREAAKAAQGKPDKTPKSPTSKPRKATLETRLAGSLATVGAMVAATGAAVSPALSADGVLIVQHSANVAAALDKVAKDDPRVAAALERMLTAGVWSGLVAALLPVAVGIAANHGALPAHLAAMLGAEVPTGPADDPAQPPIPFG